VHRNFICVFYYSDYNFFVLLKSEGAMNKRLIGLLLLLATVFFGIFRFILFRGDNVFFSEMVYARQEMAEAIKIVKEEKIRRGISIDVVNDPNQTGIIGIEYSEITTTPGELEAKRTTANPDMAALMVTYFKELGLENGDRVVIGSSASFPALYIATISACKSMGLIPLSLISLTASEWGANIPQYHLLDMVSTLKNKGKGEYYPIAVSVGGEEDTGKGLSDDAVALLEEDILKSGVHFVRSVSLYDSVLEKLALVEEKVGLDAVSVFVNIGGASANVGTDPIFLYLKPGINHVTQFAPPQTGGLLYAFARRQIPIIHLLYVKGLCTQNGLPWDPIPFPQYLSIQKHVFGTNDTIALSFLVISFWSIVLFLRILSGLYARRNHRFLDR
jgi:poly-gamma-glutamate system protein